MADEATVEVRILTTDVNSAQATAQVSANLARMNTSADVLMQQQIARERQVEQMLAQQGIRASPGVGSLSAKNLRALGLSEAELASLGGAEAGRAGGNQYERVLAGRMAGLGGVSNLMGFSGPMIGVGAAALGAGAAFSAGKSLVDTYRDEQKALRDLKLAYEDAGVPFEKYNLKIEDFLNKNAPYINDINAVREGYATLTRAGIDQTNVQRAVNDALDISGNTGKSFSDSLNLVLGGLEGNTRGLKLLGIQVKDYGDLTGGVAAQQKAEATAQKEVATATETLTNAQRALYEEKVRLQDKGYATHNDLLHEQDLQEKVTDSTQKLKDAQANYASVVKNGNNVVQDRAALLGEIGQKEKDGRKTGDDLSKAQNDLNRQWERLSNTVGPGALTTLAGIEHHMADILSDVVTHDLPKGVHDFSDTLANLPIGPLAQVAQLWGFIAQKVQEANASASPPTHRVTGPHGNSVVVTGPPPVGAGSPNVVGRIGL